MTRFLRLTIAIAGSLLAAVPASGHEFWIEPATWSPEPGATFRVELRHGERFQGQPVPRPESMRRFELVGPNDTAPVVGRAGAPVSFARTEEPGAHVLAYHSARQRNELDADAFEAYLREEGLDGIVTQRAERGESGRPGREVYSRCAKAIVVSGTGTLEDRMLGLPLEIVLDAAPEPRPTIVARVLFEGRPLKGVTVVAVHADTPGKLARQKTDEQGRVRFPAVPGAWMLTTIHMTPAAEEVDAEWESFWASLTFAHASEHNPGPVAARSSVVALP